MSADWKADARAGFEQVLTAVDERVLAVSAPPPVVAPPPVDPPPPVVPVTPAPLGADIFFALDF